MDNGKMDYIMLGEIVTGVGEGSQGQVITFTRKKQGLRENRSPYSIMYERILALVPAPYENRYPNAKFLHKS